MSIPRILTGLAALAALGGCQTLEQAIQPVPVAQPSHPTYCYRTLASVNCYLTPRSADTLVGVDVPPPPRPANAQPGQPGQPGQPQPPTMPGAMPGVTPVVTPVSPPPPVTMLPAAEAQPPGSPPVTAPSSGPAQLSPYGAGGAKRPQQPGDALYGYPPPAQ